MFETLFTIGSFQLKTTSLFQLIAFFNTALVMWRRAKEENYSEAEVFDGFLLSFLTGWLTGRIAYVIFAWERFGWDVIKWLNFVQYPGVQLLFALIGATVYFFYFSKKKKWDSFELLDWWAQAVTMGLIWINLGYFFAGTRFGHVTSLPWGIIFPGVFERRHPIQLYFLLFHVVTFKYLHWLEYHYRTFEWYRSGKKTAQSGFLFAVFMISYAFFSLIIGFFHVPTLLVNNFVLDNILFILLLILGLYLLFLRTNRRLISVKDKRPLEQ
jgi:phosphatidylglycerol:prolipoprotein diacylglycerol transferase